MKLLRVGPKGQEKPAILDASGNIRDLSGHIADIDGQALSDLSWLNGVNIESCRIVRSDERIGPCVANVGKFICVGLNYSDHAEEAGMAIPEEPILFMKATSSIIGPNDPIEIPKGAEKVDWEVELGIVIGKTAKNIAENEAINHIAGYCVVNDVSERAFQLERGGQWLKGKSADTFGPIGPWLVTKDEVSDVQELDLWLNVNGERQQTGSTSKMIFGVTKVVSYISDFMTLQPGDIITTGTPPGVGMGQSPEKYLKSGDTLQLGVAGLGVQETNAT